jgi:hypothetical protein
MVLPTPFERLLQETVQLANRDPGAAFARLDDLYGKSLSEQDVLQLGSFAVHLGATSLGRWQETAAFQHRLLTHPALIPDSPIAHSLWRGLAVVERGAGRTEAAAEAISKGVHGIADECRLAVMSAQTLAVRGRAQEGIAYLRQAALLCADLDPKDEIIMQVASVAGNLMRLAEPQVRLAQELLIASATAHSSALSRASDWRITHRAWFQQGLAYCLSAKPMEALRCVQLMMEFEDRHGAGPAERYMTAALACRAQAVRGQFKIAAGALEACQDFAKRVDQPDMAKQIQLSLTELESFLANAQQN